MRICSHNYLDIIILIDLSVCPTSIPRNVSIWRPTVIPKFFLYNGRNSSTIASQEYMHIMPSTNKQGIIYSGPFHFMKSEFTLQCITAPERNPLLAHALKEPAPLYPMGGRSSVQPIHHLVSITFHPGRRVNMPFVCSLLSAINALKEDEYISLQTDSGHQSGSRYILCFLTYQRTNTSIIL